jgi:hypothetical protein
MPKPNSRQIGLVLLSGLVISSVVSGLTPASALLTYGLGLFMRGA